MVGFRRSRIANVISSAFTHRLRKKVAGKRKAKIVKHYGKSAKRAAKKTKTNRTVGSDNGMTGGSAHIVIHAGKHKQQAKGKWIYSQFISEVPFSNAGSQGTQSFYMGTISQLTTSTGVGYNGFENQVGLRLMNPNFLNTGSGYIPAAGVPTTDMFVISKMKMEFEITSWMDLAQTVDMYFYVAKVGTQDNIATTWARGYQQQGSGKSIMTRLTSPSYQGVAGYGSTAEPYAKPTDVKEYLKDYWTLKSHREFNIGSGATQKFVYNIDANVLVKSSELDVGAADGNITYPGLTCGVILVVRGQIVCDTNTAINKPTFATTRLGVVSKQTYVCHTVNCPLANRTVGIHSYNLPIDTAVANQLIIDVNDDIDVARPVVP